MGTFKKLPIFHEMITSWSIRSATVVVFKYHDDPVSWMCCCMVLSETVTSFDVSVTACSFKLELLYFSWGRRVIGISGSLIWSETLVELIFSPCDEFRWSPEGPVSQIHSPHLLFGAPGIFSDLSWFVQMQKREWGAESNGKLPHLFIP